MFGKLKQPTEALSEMFVIRATYKYNTIIYFLVYLVEDKLV